MNVQKSIDIVDRNKAKVNTIRTQDGIYKINKFLCLVFCIWSAWPHASYFLGKQFGVFLALLWFLTGGYSIFMRRWSMNLVLTVIFTITLIPYFAWGDLEHSPINYLGVYYLFFLGMLFYQYYATIRNDKEFLGRTAWITSLFYALGAIQTYIGLSIYPEASRILARGSLDPDLKRMYSGIGIGGFNYVYSACFLVIMLFHIWFTQRGGGQYYRKIVLISLVIVLTLTIMKASYAIAIFIVLVGTISVLVFRSKTALFITATVTALVLLSIQGNMVLLFQKFADIFRKNQIIFNKINDLARTLLSESSSNSTSTSFRVYLYMSSLKAFVNEPLLGVNGPFGNRLAFIGEHSGWFDMMARYGLLVTIPLFGSIIAYFRNLTKRFKGTSALLPLVTIFVLFGIYGAINPVFSLYQISLVVFFIIPSFPYLSYAYPTERLTMHNPSVWQARNQAPGS